MNKPRDRCRVGSLHTLGLIEVAAGSRLRRHSGAMPFTHYDPPQEAIFAAVRCGAVEIPVDDVGAWVAYPRERWVYDRLAVAQTQGLPCGPHGVEPPRYPVFSKPIVNLWGMGTGARVVRRAREFVYQPGHFWMPLLSGRHVSTDVALVPGRAAWMAHTVGHPGPAGTFRAWEVLPRRLPAIERLVAAWCRRHLPRRTGTVNVETLGGTIIEVHLRFSPQFMDLYGEGWLDAVARLHCEGVWEFRGAPPRGWSLPLFTTEDGVYEADESQVERAREGVLRLQLTYARGVPLSREAHPAGGYLLAYVNCLDLGAGRRALRRLRRAIRRVD